MGRNLVSDSIKLIVALSVIVMIAGLASATTFITPSDDTLMIESRAIVTGKVISMGAAYDEGSGFVFSFVKIKVSQVFKGNILSNVITLKEVGGEADGHGTVIYSRPQFELRKRVLLYLDTWPDGSLRVRDQFLGMFSIYEDPGTGKLMAGRFGPEGEDNAIPVSPGGQTTNRMEYRSYIRMLRQHLTANMERSVQFEQTYFSNVPMFMTPPGYDFKLSGGSIKPEFHVFNPPARWFQPDSGQPVTVVINTTNQPSANARSDVDAAMNAWSTVSGCSLRVVDGGTTSACSGLVSGETLVDFNNCRNFFSSSGGTCQSILAEGGFSYTTGASKVVSGTSFYQITAGFISFNPWAACSFSSDCNVQEITTHEMGHSLGMQHSWDPTYPGSPTATEQAATMYYIAHFDGRCASVMTDDIAGITFIYPGSAAQYSGSFDGAGCNVIEGWAWDATNPGTAISVDIYDGSTLVGTASAGMYREDLLNVLGSPNHGFSFPTPATLKDGANHSVTVKIHGTSTTLPGGPRTVHCSGAGAFQGALDGVGCVAISGWAWDSTEPGGVVNVDLYDGATLIGSVTATLYRQDLQNTFGSPYHGFTFPAPSSLKDGQPHTITAKFGGTSTSLTWNNPQSFSCTGVASNFQGSQDAANCTTISGYAWDTNNDRCTIDVAIYKDGAFQVVIPAQQALPGVGNGYHGFAFAVPAAWKDGKAHSILVRFSGTGTAVSNSPRSMTCP